MASGKNHKLMKTDELLLVEKTVTSSQLESHLWESANILRGPVDAADFKTYVFPLRFFMRISDVHDEEYQAALAESGGDEEYALFPQNYRFQIPDDCHWDDVRSVASNVGQALQKARRGIENANPETLYGIFGDAPWTNKDRLPDSLLRDLIEHFSRINLGTQAAQADILGQSYEYRIKKFADATNKKAGEFYTPRPVVRLMVNILDPKEANTVRARGIRCWLSASPITIASRNAAAASAGCVTRCSITVWISPSSARTPAIFRSLSPDRAKTWIASASRKLGSPSPRLSRRG